MVNLVAQEPSLLLELLLFHVNVQLILLNLQHVLIRLKVLSHDLLQFLRGLLLLYLTRLLFLHREVLAGLLTGKTSFDRAASETAGVLRVEFGRLLHLIESHRQHLSLALHHVPIHTLQLVQKRLLVPQLGRVRTYARLDAARLDLGRDIAFALSGCKHRGVQAVKTTLVLKVPLSDLVFRVRSLRDVASRHRANLVADVGRRHPLRFFLV